jgi:RNA polymerase sigma-70 factor (ECF subfamily)
MGGAAMGAPQQGASGSPGTAPDEKRRVVTSQADGDWIPRSSLDEERLLIERARRCPVAFGQLYQRHAERVYAYTYKRTQNHEDAEDIVSETFLLAFRNMERYEWRNVPFSAWLFRIASNQVALHYRRSHLCLPLEDLAVEDVGVDLEAEAERISDRQEMRYAISLLNLDQQRAIELRYREDLPTREIAARMSRTEGSVRLLLHRATNTLRARVLPLTA